MEVSRRPLSAEAGASFMRTFPVLQSIPGRGLVMASYLAPRAVLASVKQHAAALAFRELVHVVGRQGATVRDMPSHQAKGPPEHRVQHLSLSTAHDCGPVHEQLPSSKSRPHP
jgi:hypothetical protein